jgi:hypothetical protein
MRSLGAFCILLLAAAVVRAQSPGVAIEPRRINTNDKALMAKLHDLREAGKLMSKSDVRAALQSPTPAAISLQPPGTQRLSSTQLAARGRDALLRIGWYYLCHKCSNWHLQIANGYAITPDGVAASCYHVLEPNDGTMRDAYLFALSSSGEVFPIKKILAADKQLDAAVFQVDGSGFVPLPVNDQNAPGDAVFLFSDPRGIPGYFSTGHINRFYWDGDQGDGNLESLAAVRNLRIDVSTDWAPGSSGAAILDEFGNAIGHVTEIAVERESPPHDSASPPSSPATQPIAGATTRPTSSPSQPPTRGTIMVLHEAVPARGVRLLVEQMNQQPSTRPGR